MGWLYISESGNASHSSKDDKHANNYGDIVWWDMLFGTYENPKEFTGTLWLDTEKEMRLNDLLQFKDVRKE